MSRAVVVIGGGHGGVELVASLRDQGFEDDVVLLEQQDDLPYQRPPLSKKYLTREHDETDLPLRSENFFSSRGIQLRLGTTVTTIDRAARIVHLHDGDSVPYRHLVLALGATSRQLDVPGAQLDGVLSLRTLDDARRLRHELTSAKTVVVVGGGFIGLEVAAFASAGTHVTVVEPQHRLMARAVAPLVSDVVASSHALAGTTVMLDSSVCHLAGHDGHVSSVVLDDGTHLPADLVIVGVGAAPATGISQSAGLATSNGILVDEYLCTSDLHISAIGDCASRLDERGVPQRVECVQNAVDQARYVANGIVHGRSAPYAAVPFFWTNQHDLRIQTVGTGAPDNELLVLGNPMEGAFSVCRFSNGWLVAVESVNRPRDHMAARKLLRSDHPLNLSTASHPDFDLKAHLTRSSHTELTEREHR